MSFFLVEINMYRNRKRHSKDLKSLKFQLHHPNG